MSEEIVPRRVPTPCVLHDNGGDFYVIGRGSVLTVQEVLCELYDSADTRDRTHRIDVEDFLSMPLEETKNKQFLVAVADVELRKQCIDHIDQNNIHCFSAIGSLTLINEPSVIGKNVCLGVLSGAGLNVTIGDHTFVSPKTVITHGAKIGRCCYIEPDCYIGGSAEIGDYVYVGIKSAVITQIKIPSNSIIAGFSNVTKSAEKPSKFVGSPARIFSIDDQS